MEKETFTAGKYSIPQPRPENDAASAYLQIAQTQIQNDADAEWDAIGEIDAKPAEPVQKNGSEIATQPETAEDTQTPTEGATGEKQGVLSQGLEIASGVASDIGKGLTEAPRQIVGGIADAFGEAGQAISSLTGLGGIQFVDQEGNFNPQFLNAEEFEAAGGDSIINALSTDDPESVTGSFVRATAQFLTGFIPALKGARAAGVTGAIAGPMVAGAIADMVVFDPHEDRLSAYLNEIPALEPFVSDYLADNNPDNEGEWEGRLKNAIEGSGLGLAAEGVTALFRAFKYYKAQRHELAKFAPEPQGPQEQAIRDMLGDAARSEFVEDIPDEALRPLGDPAKPFIEEVDKAEIEAYLRGAENRLPSEFKTEMRDFHHGQSDQTLVATRNGNSVGKIDYSVFEGVPSIQMIEVSEEFRRQGIATEMLKKLQSEFPDVEIDWGSLTEDGAKLYKSTKFVDVDQTSGINEVIGDIRTKYEKAEAEYQKSFSEGYTGDRDKARDALFSAEDELEKAIALAETPPKRLIDQAVDKKVFINHARIQTADDVKAIIQQMADQDADTISAKARGVVTNEQTIKESSQEYRDLDDLIGRPPGPMTAAQAVAARRLLTSSGEQVADLAAKAASPNASKADIYNFRRSMAVHYAIQSEVIAARTETARALQSWAIPAGASKARSQAISDLIIQNGGANDIQALARDVASVKDNQFAVNVMARELGKGKFGRALYQVWINGLLSSPKTHMVNILSNSMVAMYSVPERLMASGISKAFYDGEISTGEVASQMFGLVKGIRDGTRLIYHGNKAEGMAGIGDVFDSFGKAETYVSDISAQAFGLNPAGVYGRGLDMLGKLVNAPGGALATEDKFFKSIGYRMELNALAYRQAASEGLEGEDAARRIVDILSDPPDHLKADALDVSHYNTFTNELGKTGKKFQSTVASIPGARLVLPFIRTPTNIIKYTFARTPLAYMSGNIRSEIRAGGAKAAQAHARVALGSMIFLNMMDLTSEGTVTGRGPLDPAMRKAKMDTGWMPYSVKVGDRWYQYSRTDPIGMMIGLGSDLAEIMGNVNGENDADMLATAAVLALANNLANKTYMTGIYDFIGAIDPSNPTNSPERYLTDFAGSMVPYSSFLRNTANTIETGIKDTRTAVLDDEGDVDLAATWFENTLNKMRAVIPGMSADLPPSRDLYGKPIDRASGIGMGWDMLSPIASRVDNPDPVTRVILDNRVSISQAPRVINGVKLNNYQYSDFVQMSGEPLKEYLDKLITQPVFKKLSDGPDGMKAEIIKKAVHDFREQGKALLVRKYPELQQLSYVKKVNKLKTLQGEPQ